MQAGTLAIGVVGHRWNRIDQRQESQLAAATAGVFAMIETCAPKVRKRIATGLAEGSDQVAAMVMPADWQLCALLPMPRLAYESHMAVHGTGDPEEAIARLRLLLSRPDTVVIDPVSQSPEAGYIAIQARILDQADLLLAIWDGAGGAGAGGTNDSVRKALARGIPVLWIDSDESRNRALRRVLAASDDGVSAVRAADESELTKILIETAIA